MFKKARFILLASPFLLAACGEGYEMVRTDAMVPYGNSRTAGTGVAYVLAKMMPEKELNLQPVKREAEPEKMTEAVEEKPAPKAEESVVAPSDETPPQTMEKVFNEENTK